jgi:putative transposase
MDPFELIQQGKVKRHFRSTKQLNSPGTISHVTQRAADKELLFVKEGDYLFMLSLLKKISEKHSLKPHAFGLMPNHVHLLLSTTKENLYNSMQDLFSRYAPRFNINYERKGHHFGSPYRQAVCIDDGYLLVVSLYIHLNPLRGGLTRNPLEYPWSSCRLFCDKECTRFIHRLGNHAETS